MQGCPGAGFNRAALEVQHVIHNMQHFTTVNIHVNHRRSGRSRLLVFLVTDSSLTSVAVCLESLPSGL